MYVCECVCERESQVGLCLFLCYKMNMFTCMHHSRSFLKGKKSSGFVVGNISMQKVK
jgi:hypothetical protein